MYLPLQDPWSRIANLESFQQTVGQKDTWQEKSSSKRKAPPSTLATAKNTRPKNTIQTAAWELLPASDIRWIRGLLDGGPACSLSALPCMKDEKLMPLEVSNLLLSGRAKIEFYSYITHNLLCTRHICLCKKIHCHAHNDKLAAVCITETLKHNGQELPCVRLFVRCFSVKCETEYQKGSPVSIRWLELTSAHYTRYKRLKHEATASSL